MRRLCIRLAVIAAVLTMGMGGAVAATTLNFFQPADSSGRVGFLALNNIGTTAVNVTLSATDDRGVRAPGGNITLTLAAGQSRYLSSQDVENGRSAVMTGAFGNGTGYWHIDVTATVTITVQNFIYTQDGALTDFTTPLTAESDGSYFVKFFTEPGASVFGSLLRLRNLSSQPGTVTITAKSSAGAAVGGSATVTLPGSNAVEISSLDLSKGNAGLGVSGGLSTGDGFWILKMAPTVSVFAQALAQAAGGQLADVGRGLTVSATAPAATCGSANFLQVKADSHNTAYAAPTLSVTCSATTMTVVSNGIPTFEFVQTTPNRLQAVAATYRIPATPSVSATKTDIPLAGPAAVTVAGLPIFGPTESKQDGYRDPYKDALLDFCNGHTAQRGDYHHHFRPECLFPAAGQKTGLVIGYAFDGYPILWPYECTDTTCNTVYKVHSSYKYTGGSTAAWSSNTYVAGSGNLDKCNGMTRPDGSYAYYATDEFPYFMGCYNGAVDSSNIVPQQP